MKLLHTVSVAVLAGMLAGSAMAAGLSTQEGVRDIGEPVVITNAGAYVVTRDLLIFGGSAIRVAADDVTIDLNGHRVQSVGFFTAYEAAIHQQGGFENLSILNGTVLGGSGAGILATGRMSRVEDVTVRDSARGGILLGDMAVAENCIVMSNALGASYTDLIRVGQGSRVARSILAQNTGTSLIGVRGAKGCVVDECILRGNSAAAGFFNGVGLDGGGVIRAVAVSGNSCADSFVGLGTGPDGTVQRCVVSRNSKGVGSGSSSGINAGENTTVRQCIVKDNTGSGGSGYGYYHWGNGSLFDSVAFSNVAGSASAYGFYMRTNVIAGRCVAMGNSYAGFYSQDGCIIKQCVAKWNQWYGMDVGSWSSVERCLVDNTGDGTDTRTGIAVNNGNVRVENNHVLDSGKGIACFGGVSFIAGNSGVNATNYVNMTGHSYGAITNQPGANFISYNPWQNFGL